jgi:hypothetical protein
MTPASLQLVDELDELIDLLDPAQEAESPTERPMPGTLQFWPLHHHFQAVAAQYRHWDQHLGVAHSPDPIEMRALRTRQPERRAA